MRCQKCGKFNFFYPKFCRKCGAAFPIKAKKSHRVFWSVLAVVFFLLAGLAYIGISQNRDFNNAVIGIQGNLAKVALAKAAGDSLAAGKKMPVTQEQLQTDGITAASNLAVLAVPDELKNYQAAAIIWSIRLAGAASPAEWKKIKNQPGDFPLALLDYQAENAFSASAKIIANLKKAGTDAIKAKDREAMLKIGAKILVQNHWLNALLHSTDEQRKALFPAVPAMAASPSGLAAVPDVKGMDVTCLVCNYPDFYKVRWTDKLRRQYGCEVRCRAKKTGEEQAAGAEKTSAGGQASEYAQALSEYSYKDAPKREICIGTGGTENRAGGVSGHKFCVEEAVANSNEIAASAIGFSQGAKTVTAEQWNYQYGALELALGVISELPAQPKPAGGQTGAPPSKPAVTGGHLEGGQGTVSTGEPIATPEPAQKTGGVWDGEYELSGNCQERCTGGVCALAEALGGLEGDAYTFNKQYQSQSTIYVFNNQIEGKTIGANGYLKVVSDAELGWYHEYQFAGSGKAAWVKENTQSGMTGWSINCAYSGARQ